MLQQSPKSQSYGANWEFLRAKMPQRLGFAHCCIKALNQSNYKAANCKRVRLWKVELDGQTRYNPIHQNFPHQYSNTIVRPAISWQPARDNLPFFKPFYPMMEVQGFEGFHRVRKPLFPCSKKAPWIQHLLNLFKDLCLCRPFNLPNSSLLKSFNLKRHKKQQ